MKRLGPAKHLRVTQPRSKKSKTEMKQNVPNALRKGKGAAKRLFPEFVPSAAAE
jgi:hypothetical protein